MTDIRQVEREAAKDDEIERLRANCLSWYEQNTDLIVQRDKVWEENKKLRAQLADTAAFLDRLANRLDAYRDQYPAHIRPAATDCRAKARELRGEP